ncbi:MAG: histidine kinase [Bacteroidales bacterium]|jgi:sensor histidine kinase YesM
MKNLSIRQFVEFSFLALLVLGFRLLIEELIPLFEENLNLTFGRFLIKLLSNYPLTLTILVLDIAGIYYFNKYLKRDNSWMNISLILVLCLIISLIAGLWQRLNLWINGAELVLFKDLYFTLTVFASFIFNLIIVSLIQVYNYYTTTQEKALNIEIGKKNKARYQYQQLKTQLNPHFLFNSLNVLDFLIHTDQDKASEFVRKLSSVYRYLLNKGDNTIVSLREEIDFVNLYVDLLKERFSDGLHVNVNVDEKYMALGIIPGGLQLLVENATKHNIVSIDSPLEINIYIEDNQLIVVNNLQPRINTIDSSGLGIKNIKGQYMLLIKKDITINKSKEFFEVRLPLI